MSDKAIRCSEILDKVGPYVDDELEAAERIDVEAHLHACPPCAEIAMEIREMDVCASRMPVPEVTVEEWTGVWSRVEAGRRNSSISSRIGSAIILAPRWRWALPAAAAILAGVFFGPWFPSEPAGNEGAQDEAELPVSISGPAPNSIDRIEGVDEEDDASYVQYSDF